MSNRRFILSLFACHAMASALLPAQNALTDSLETAFYAESADSLRWQAAIALSEEWAFIQTDTALAWAERGHRIAQQLQDPPRIAQSLYQLGAAAYKKRELRQAMGYFLQALQRFEALGDDRRRMDTRLEIGQIYRDRKEYGKARRYLDEFLHFYQQQGQAEAANIIYALNQYVVHFEQTEQTDSMLHYARATLEAAQRYGQDKYLANIHNNLASVYLYAKNYDKAQYHFKQAERIGFGPNKIGRFYNFYALADMYRSLQQADSSTHYARRALSVARSFGDLEKEAQIHLLLSGLHQDGGNYRSAYFQLDTFMQLKDSLIAQRHERDLSELSVKYETQEKEARIAQQQLELQRAANRRNRLLFASVLGFLLLAGLFLYLRHRQRARARQTALKLQYQQAEAQRLRELDQLKSNFFANISHEFRTPLTLLLSPLREMARANFRGDADSYLKTMERQGERLLSLVDQMLDLSRLQSGAMPRQTEHKDLGQFVRLTAAAFESLAQQKGVNLQMDLPQHPLPALLDPDKLEKILNNLLSNALKFTPAGQHIWLSLSVEETEDELQAQIRVKDNGPGIPPEQLPHIFERFYQGEPQQGQEQSGAGIGLALSQELAHFMGGTIEAESEPGHGSCFTLQLPFAKAAAAEMPAAPLAEAKTAEASSTANQPLVLIAEDHAELRQYLRGQLSEDYLILEAENGQTGLELAKSRMPELIISDVRMPGMDGLAFAERLKQAEATSHIPIILLTALAERPDVHAGLSTGADAYLTKPFDTEELRIRAAQLIQQRRELREKFARALRDNEATPKLANPADAAFLDKVEQAVQQRLDQEDFSIAELGRELGMSRSQLHRKIKALTDQSPSVFVRTLRLREAYRLLRERRGNISEIAHEVGMPNLAHFSRSFKELYGKPPSQV